VSWRYRLSEKWNFGVSLVSSVLSVFLFNILCRLSR